MRKLRICILSAVVLFSLLSISDCANDNGNRILIANFSGIISPISSEYLGQSIDKANSENYNALVIELDTPGGLDLSMREIIKKILNSKVPVIVYVYPSGARAASAGVFITMSAHVAAMAPGTNIGAAHPVMLKGTPEVPSTNKDKKEETKNENPMEEKVLNDAVAYIKSIATQRNRNVAWAVKAVTESDSIPADTAVKTNVVDFMAENQEELLKKLDGMKVKDLGTIRTKDAKIDYFNPSARQKILAAITNPNVAMILMSLGAAGLFIELYNPGLILPGVVGAMSIIMAFYSFHTLSANFAGLLFVFLGMIFLIAEVKVTSYGLLAVSGIISILTGMLMLFSNTANMGINLSTSIIVSTVLGLAAITFIVAWITMRAHMRKVTTGKEGLEGEKGIAKSTLSPKGKVLVAGELWDAESLDGKIHTGDEIVVDSVKGFKLFVKKSS
jgi:membrane-bound serine protease (ClpP class)